MRYIFQLPGCAILKCMLSNQRSEHRRVNEEGTKALARCLAVMSKWNMWRCVLCGLLPARTLRRWWSDWFVSWCSSASVVLHTLWDIGGESPGRSGDKQNKNKRGVNAVTVFIPRRKSLKPRRVNNKKTSCGYAPSRRGSPCRPAGCSLWSPGGSGSGGSRARWWSPSALRRGWSPGQRCSPPEFAWPPRCAPSPRPAGDGAVRGRESHSSAEMHSGGDCWLMRRATASPFTGKNNNTWGSGPGDGPLEPATPLLTKRGSERTPRHRKDGR